MMKLLFSFKMGSKCSKCFYFFLNFFQALIMTALLAVSSASPLGFGLGAPLLPKVIFIYIQFLYNSSTATVMVRSKYFHPIKILDGVLLEALENTSSYISISIRIFIFQKFLRMLSRLSY